MTKKSKIVQNTIDERRKIVVILQLQNMHLKTQKIQCFIDFIEFKTLIDSRIQKQLSPTIFPLEQGLRPYLSKIRLANLEPHQPSFH
jgi:hypothetical protein